MEVQHRAFVPQQGRAADISMSEVTVFEHPESTRRTTLLDPAPSLNMVELIFLEMLFDCLYELKWY